MGLLVVRSMKAFQIKAECNLFFFMYAIVTESKFSKKVGGENEERNQDGEDMSSESEGSPHL